MRKTFILLCLLALPALCWAFGPAIQAVISSGAAAAPAGSWQYNGTQNTDTGWYLEAATARGGDVAVAGNGTVKKLGICISTIYLNGATAVKMALYDGSGNIVTSGTISSFTGGTGSCGYVTNPGQWFDVTVSDGSVSAGTYRLAAMSNSDTSLYATARDDSKNGIVRTVSYASFPETSGFTTSNVFGQCPIIRMWVE